MAAKKLTLQEFKDNIFDFTQGNDWSYKGGIPAVIDFYADWCGPCKMVAPIMDELSKEYDGKVKIYKVDTEVEQELSAMFRIKSIPSILFIPKEGTPMMQPGALPANAYKEIIEDKLL